MSGQPKKGFTLIELLVAISIVALLSTMAFTSLSGVRKKARDSQRLADARAIVNALNLYYSDNRTYPNCYTASTNSDWVTCLGTELSPYLKRMPVDPINNIAYSYRFYSEYGPSGLYRRLYVNLENPNGQFATVPSSWGSEWYYQGYFDLYY